jgi:hypothetical protein
LADLPHILFFFLVLPIILLLLLIPASWYEAESYADLGVVDFVASEVAMRVRQHEINDHDIIYRATDGSGLSFLEAATRQSARAAVREQRHVQRHVYISHQKPAGVLRLFRLTTGQVFLPVEEDLQDYLDTGRRITAATYVVGFGYTVVYLSGVVLCRRKRREKGT